MTDNKLNRQAIRQDLVVIRGAVDTMAKVVAEMTSHIKMISEDIETTLDRMGKDD